RPTSGTNTDGPAELLWQKMSSTFPSSSFPEGVVKVPQAIQGTAFFPGGYGVWLEENLRPPFPIGQIMVVGQDFNSVAAYDRARKAKTEVKISRTWRALIGILDASGISRDRCFFTNVYMGLREEEKETGRFPGAKDKEFVHRCVEFFKLQLEVARPKLILTLGLEPLRVLAACLFHIADPKTLKECSEVYSVVLEHGNVTVVALTHPSYSHVNGRLRKFGNLVGKEAERAMIEEGLERAF
ncbi:MAG: uracil-DNA glycosylase family protein, partial [Acidobacteriota bacterium]